MKARYFILLAIFLAAGAIVMTRVYERQVQRQITAITTADAASLDTTALLQALSQYVTAHMGTSATVTLQASYERAVTAAQTAAAGGVAQGQVYAQAQAACAGRNDSIVQAKCVAAYVASHATPASQPQVAATPVLATYQHSYSAPVWTPDVAGGLWLGALAALIAAAAIWLRQRLRQTRQLGM
jgi:hypothetical protein